MATAHFVKRARKCPQRGSGIYKGDSYWWWKFKSRAKGVNTPRIVSKTRPRRSQLTRSSFLKTVYDLEDGVSSQAAYPVNSLDDARAYVEYCKETLESLKSECEESLEAIPENLRETSSSGVLLQERIEGIEQWIDALDSVELEETPEELLEEDDEENNGEAESRVSYSEKIAECSPGSW